MIQYVSKFTLKALSTLLSRMFKFTSHNSPMFIINSGSSCETMFNNDFTGYENMRDCMASVPTDCPFNWSGFYNFICVGY